ncbi:hypothetical protein J2S31_002013 [Nitrospina gracilis Nb-211]|nr:hypothetical protein [Nitrospina gracilis Nb-211]
MPPCFWLWSPARPCFSIICQTHSGPRPITTRQ